MVAEATTSPGRGRRLLLVRHGRTAWNAEGRAQGHADVGLDDIGRAQAEAMADVLAEREPALLVSSDLSRARETAAFLEKATGLTAVEDARLREYDLGERTGLTLAEFGERLGVDVEGWSDVHGHIVVPGAETHEDVAARVVPALRGGPGPARSGRDRPGRAPRCRPPGRARRPAGLADRDGGDDRVDAQLRLGEVAEHEAGRLRLSTYNPARQLTPIRIAGRSLAKIPGVAQGSGQRWGCGAVGSAPAWHAGGQGFESPQLHPVVLFRTRGRRRSW